MAAVSQKKHLFLSSSFQLRSTKRIRPTTRLQFSAHATCRTKTNPRPNNCARRAKPKSRRGNTESFVEFAQIGFRSSRGPSAVEGTCRVRRTVELGFFDSVEASSIYSLVSKWSICKPPNQPLTR